MKNTIFANSLSCLLIITILRIVKNSNPLILTIYSDFDFKRIGLNYFKMADLFILILHVKMKLKLQQISF